MTNHDRYITLRLPAAMNKTARLFGYPTVEFLFLSIFAVVGMNYNGYIGILVFSFIILVGKIRAKKPVNWLTFLPYLWLRLKYAYLLPPGKRTFLP